MHHEKPFISPIPYNNNRSSVTEHTIVLDITSETSPNHKIQRNKCKWNVLLMEKDKKKKKIEWKSLKIYIKRNTEQSTQLLAYIFCVIR